MFDAKRYIEDMIDGLRDPLLSDATIKYEGIKFMNNSDNGGKNCNAEENGAKNSIQ